MITVLHRGGYAQMITILHGGGSLGTPKSDYVICARPLSCHELSKVVKSWQKNSCQTDTNSEIWGRAHIT